jgi:hypothetical protein
MRPCAATKPGATLKAPPCNPERTRQNTCHPEARAFRGPKDLNVKLAHDVPAQIPGASSQDNQKMLVGKVSA